MLCEYDGSSSVEEARREIVLPYSLPLALDRNEFQKIMKKVILTFSQNKNALLLLIGSSSRFVSLHFVQ